MEKIGETKARPTKKMCYFRYHPRNFDNEYTVYAVPNDRAYIRAIIPAGAERITRRQAAKDARWRGDAFTHAYTNLVGCYVGSPNPQEEILAAGWARVRMEQLLRILREGWYGRPRVDLSPWEPARL